MLTLMAGMKSCDEKYQDAWGETDGPFLLFYTLLLENPLQSMLS